MMSEIEGNSEVIHFISDKVILVHGSLLNPKYKSDTWLSTSWPKGHTGKDRVLKPTQGSAGPSHSYWVLSMQMSKYKK